MSYCLFVDTWPSISIILSYYFNILYNIILYFSLNVINDFYEKFIDLKMQ